MLQQEIKREQEKEFMLRNEERRLREEDIRKLRDRQKRLNDVKKVKILVKDKESDEFYRHIKESEEMLQRKRL